MSSTEQLQTSQSWWIYTVKVMTDHLGPDVLMSLNQRAITSLLDNADRRKIALDWESIEIGLRHYTNFSVYTTRLRTL